LKIAFKIPPVVNNFSDLHLLVEAGNEDISFLLFKKTPLIVEGFYSYNLNKHISHADYAAAVTNILAQEDMLKQIFASTNIFYNFNTSTLIPAEYFIDDEKSNVCDTIFGQDKAALCFQENVKGNDIKLIYRVPDKVYEALNNVFPKNNFAHSTSEQINFVSNNTDTLQCIIYHASIKVLLVKEGKIHLVQYFDYETPADVCYHLLNVCERFQIPAASINLILSGMVDKDSSLFTEVYKYFLHVSLSAAFADVTVAEDLKELPQHFYNHLTALAQCV
jgi:hypothetical protein